MPVVAHAADYVSLAFFVPVVAFIAWLAVGQLRARRARGGDRGAASAEPPAARSDSHARAGGRPLP